MRQRGLGRAHRLDAQHAQKLRERVGRAQRHGGGGVLARVGEVGVCGCDQAEDGGQGAGGVKVVVHLARELGRGLVDLSAQCAVGVVELAVLRSALGGPAQVGHRAADALERAHRAVEAVEREVERRAVVGLQHEQAHRVGRVLVEHLLEREEVAEALAHLLAVDEQHARVHPHVGERLVPAAAGLGVLVLVVRELQVLAAAVDVDGRAQVAVHHGRALGVPARATLAPGAVPHGLAGLGRLPEGEVERVSLLVVGLDARAHLELVNVAAGHATVAGVGAHGEVDVAVAGRIGVALLDEALNHLDHRGDLARGTRANVGVEHVQAMHLLDEGVGELRGHLLRRAALLVGAVDDLVVHVGEVLGEGDLVALVGEVAADDVEGQKRAAVAHVDLVVDGGPAHVHADLARLDGLEFLLLVRLAVVDEHGYSFS